MSKTNVQKAARQRRRTRQKQLVEAGRQAADLASQHRQQAAEAAIRIQRLEGENAQLRHDHGETTSLLAESNKALNSNITILEGLRTELDMAAQQVKMAEAERDAMSRDLSQARHELAVARAADIDTRSLRTRLQHKTEEIEELKAKLRASEERHQSSPGALVPDNERRRLVRSPG
jgi:chromosome segregation ATPase